MTTADLNANAAVMDLTAGRWQSATTISNADTLRDINEWAKMISLGRGSLVESTFHDMCLYASTFNGAVLTDDYCGWGETITNSNVTAGVVNYPTSGCRIDTDCDVNDGTGGAVDCKFDQCASSTDCRVTSNACSVGGTCTCSVDSHCFSGQCVAGLCATTWGGCGCSIDTDCDGTDAVCVSGRCNGFFSANLAVGPTPGEGVSQPFALKDSAAFNGTSAALNLGGGTDSRLEALSSSFENGFTMMFDFRFDGFQGAETEHILFHSGAFKFKIVYVSGGIQVQSYVNETHTLTFNIEKGRWYRGVWSAQQQTGGTHFLWLRKWDVEIGWYDAGTTSNDCVYKSLTSSVPSPGTVRVGHDGSSDTDLFYHGRVDNVSLVNYQYRMQPTNCTQQ